MRWPWKPQRMAPSSSSPPTARCAPRCGQIASYTAPVRDADVAAVMQREEHVGERLVASLLADGLVVRDEATLRLP